MSGGAVVTVVFDRGGEQDQLPFTRSEGSFVELAGDGDVAIEHGGCVGEGAHEIGKETILGLNLFESRAGFGGSGIDCDGSEAGCGGDGGHDSWCI